jgi:hypothetical protein
VDRDFLDKWNGKSVGTLVELTRKTMPSDGPGKLSRRQCVDIVSYVLSANGFPAGNAELESDAASNAAGVAGGSAVSSAASHAHASSTSGLCGDTESKAMGGRTAAGLRRSGARASPFAPLLRPIPAAILRPYRWLRASDRVWYLGASSHGRDDRGRAPADTPLPHAVPRGAPARPSR